MMRSSCSFEGLLFVALEVLKAEGALKKGTFRSLRGALRSTSMDGVKSVSRFVHKAGFTLERSSDRHCCDCGDELLILSR